MLGDSGAICRACKRSRASLDAQPSAAVPPYSAIAFFLPDVPIGADRFKGSFSGVVQPLAFLFLQVTENGLARAWGAEMDVCGFPAHGVDDAKLGVGTAQGCEFDAAAQRAEAADDPASAQLDKGIGGTDGAVDDGLIENFRGSFLILCPACGGLDQRFGFPCDASAVPVGDGNKACVTETSESGGTVGEAIANAGGGHEMFDGVDGADGGFALKRRQRVHFFPEADGVTKFVFGDDAQPGVTFPKNKRTTFFF